MTISLEEDATLTQPTMSLENAPSQITTYSPNQLEEKTFKAMFSVGAPGSETPFYRSSIASGDEIGLRMRDADRIWFERQAENEQIIKDFAAMKEGPVTADEEAIILDMINAQRDPEGYKRIWEEEYAQAVLSNATNVDEYDDAAEENFHRTANTDLVASEFLWKTEYLNNKLAEIVGRMDESLPRTVIDWVGAFLPLVDYTEYLIAAGLTEEEANVLFQGTGRQDIIDELWTLPPGEFERRVDAYAEALSGLNNLHSIDFLDGMLNSTNEGKVIRDMIPFLDFADLGSLAVIAKIRSIRKVKNKDLSKHEKKISAAVEETVKGGSPEAVLENAGEVERASVVRLIKRSLANSTALTQPTPQAIKADLDALPSVLDPSASGRQSPPKLGRRVADIDLPDETIRSMPEQSLRKGWDEAVDTLTDFLWAEKPLRANFSEMVADTRYIREEDSKTGAPAVQLVVTLPDDTLAKTRKAAEAFADQLTLKHDNIEELPSGDFALVFEQPVDRTSGAVLKNFELDPESMFEPGGIRRSVRHLHTAMENMSQFQRGVLKTGFHKQQKLTKDAQELLKPITDLNKKSLDRLDNVLNAGRLDKRWYTPKQLKKKWVELNGQTPTAEEVAGYEAAIRINDTEHAMKEAMYLRYKSLQGRKRLTFRLPDGTEVENDAKILLKLPKDRKQIKDFFSVAVVGDKEVKAVSRFDMTDKRLNGFLEKGYKLIQVGDARSKPLGTDYVAHFALVQPDAIRNMPATGHVNYVPGGHFQYDAAGYLKFPKLSKTKNNVVYTGDTSVFAFPDVASGLKWEKLFKEAIALARQGRPYRKFVEDNLPFSAKKFDEMVRKGIIDLSPEGANPAFVRSGSSMYEASSEFKKWANSHPGFVNHRHNHWDIDNPLRQEQERNETLHNILEMQDEEGTVSYSIAPAKQVSPITTAQKALQQTIRRNTLEKAVDTAAVHFTEALIAAGDQPASLLRADPLRTMLESNLDLKKLDDRKLAGKLQMMKLSAENLLGQNAPMSQTWADWMSNLQGALDPTKKSHAALLNGVELMQTSDFTRFMRSVAFNLKFSFYNAVQFAVQSQTFVTMIGMQPRDGLAMTAGAFALRLARMNRNGPIRKGLGELAEAMSELGLGRAEFQEITELLDENGWEIIRGSHSFIDDAGDPRLMAGMTQRALEKMTFFFSETELMLRLGGYIGAYKHIRRQLPKGAKLTQKHKDAILTRAGDLTVNMTRDSVASWQRGGLSMTTQFLGYQARLFDLVFASRGRISTAERIGILASLGAAYGMFTPVETATLAAPVRDSAKEFIERHPYLKGTIDESVLLQAVTDGIPHAFFSMMGYELGITERLGPSHIPILQDVFFNPDNKTLAEQLGGASLSIGIDALTRLEPFVWAVQGMFSGEEYPLTQKDFVEAFGSISTVSQATRLYAALNTHRFLTSRGRDLGAIDSTEATIFALTGVSPERFSDMGYQLSVMKGESDAKKHFGKQLLEEYTDMLKAIRDGNAGAAEKHMTRAYSIVTMGGFNQQELNSLFRRATDGMDKGLQEQVLESFFLRSPEESGRTVIELLERQKRNGL